MAEASPPLKSWNDLGGLPGLPIAGNLFQLHLDTFHRTLERWADRYGRLYRVFDVALADPERPVEERLAFTMMPTGMVVRMRRRVGNGR